MVMIAQPQQPNPLAGVSVVYYVSKRDSITRLPPLRRLLIRFTYMRCLWASGYSVQSMGVFTDPDAALIEAKRRSEQGGDTWAVKALPVNACLPDEPCEFGIHCVFPGSATTQRVSKHKGVTFDAVSVKEVETMTRELSTLSEIVTKPAT